MSPFLLTTAVGFGLGILFTVLARRIANAVNLVDRSDGRGKRGKPIPIGGGVAVFLAAALAILAALLVFNPLGERLLKEGTGLIGLALAAAIICGVGLADDIRTLPGRYKLFGQLVAVGTVIGSGVVVQNITLFGYRIVLGPLALPFTALWLLGAINCLNLIDGMDGLLGCVGSILCLAMAVLAVASGQWAAAAVACALAGALLAFLCFNFPPASIFMGDSGSMLVGLVIGTIAIQGSLKGPATAALAAPTALLTIPLLDALAAILRRKLTGRSIYSTDRGHIHYCLLRRGLSNRRVLLLVSTLCLLTVAGSLGSLALGNELFAVVGALLVVNVLVVGRLFGHAEFLLLKELLVSLLGRHPRAQPRQMEVRLQGSADWAELWTGLTNSADPLQLETICLDVNAPAIYEGYHARWDWGGRERETAAAWHMEVPLLVHGQRVGRLEISGRLGSESLGEKLATVSRWGEEVGQAVAALASLEARENLVTPPPAMPFLVDPAPGWAAASTSESAPA